MAVEVGEKWLQAFADPMAALYTFPACMTLSDLNGDGEYKLIVADLGTVDYNKKLKVYRGVGLHQEQPLNELPIAVCTFNSDQVTPNAPAIAVASGGNIYVYKNMRPYYKFAVPGDVVDETEKTAWMHANNGDIDVDALTVVLTDLRNRMTLSALSVQSQRYLLITSTEDRQQFVRTYTTATLRRAVTVTAMTTLKKNSLLASSIDTLIVTTEDCRAFTVLSVCQLPANATPVHIHASGLYDVDYRILVCCRNAAIYTIKRGVTKLDTATIQLWSHAIGMVKVGKFIVVGCKDKTLRRYTLKGRRVHTFQTPAAITSVAAMVYEPKQINAVIVAMDNATTFLVNTIQLDEVASSVMFGCYGREEGAMVIVYKNGGLAVKLLRRISKFDEKAINVGAPLGQMQKLNIPKKTKVFVDQTLREREEAGKMHQVFQRDLFMTRLHVARAYAKMLDTAQAPVSLNSDEMMKISVAVHGFGPQFLMIIYLKTMSVEAITGLTLTFDYNTRLYKVEKNVIPCAMLVPGIEYTYETKVTCLMPDTGLSEDIRCMVVKGERETASITAQVAMPVSEQSLVD